MVRRDGKWVNVKVIRKQIKYTAPVGNVANESRGINDGNRYVSQSVIQL